MSDLVIRQEGNRIAVYESTDHGPLQQLTTLDRDETMKLYAWLGGVFGRTSSNGHLVKDGDPPRRGSHDGQDRPKD